MGGGGGGGVVERMSVTELLAAGFLALLLQPTTVIDAAIIAIEKACFTGEFSFLDRLVKTQAIHGPGCLRRFIGPVGRNT
jgi:hypothetical protein